MKVITRRKFLATSCGITGYLSCAAAWAETRTTPYDMVAKVDHNRILAEAARYLSEKPITLAATRSSRSSGGLHDYFSEGDYWWPNPNDPGGPYIRRDGLSNPQNFNAHRDALIRLSLIVPALTTAWKLTGDQKYADHAGSHLRAWFVDPATRMNPNLQYAQAIFGVSKGRGIGIIDTLHLVEPARAATLLMAAGALQSGTDIQRWFADYLEWMRTSQNGQQERDAKNNHGTCWVLQAGEFARFTNNEEVMSWCRERFKTVLVPLQIAANGSLPLELARTKPYSYSLFDMDVLCSIAQSLSIKDDDLWSFATPDKRGLR
ncbi:MAG: alginate lyase family protein, partial [Edaphobacter sp.]